MKAIKKLIEDATKKDSLDNLSHKELEGLIETIYAEANCKIELEEMREREFTALEVAAIQDLTLNCYNELSAYDEYHTSVLCKLRKWGLEFEEWWHSLILAGEEEDRDYFSEIIKFGSKKLKELRHSDIADKLAMIAKDIKYSQWVDDDDKNIIAELNNIIDQLKKEE